MSRHPLQNYGASLRRINPFKPWRAWYKDRGSTDRYAGLYAERDEAVRAAKKAWLQSRTSVASDFLSLPCVARNDCEE